jgi:Ca2+-binding EF-hand superfamily protein
MIKKGILSLVMVLLAAFLVSSVEAQPKKGPKPKFRHTDRNKDGRVDRKEMRMQKKWEKKQRAEKVKTWWHKRADTDGDGKLNAQERAAWKTLTKERIDLDGDGVISPKERRLCWRHARSRVNTALEKKYDANDNGWLEPEEVKELFKNRYEHIKAHGKAKVDSPLEEEYDENDDGVIDANEAEVINEDIEETE